MKKKILFLIYTEMQFLVCHLYFKNFFSENEWNPCYMFLSSNKNRFKSIDFKLIKGRVIKSKNELNTIKFNVDKQFLSIYKESSFDHIVFSNPGFFINYSIINYFVKQNNNLELTLISDGVGEAFRENFIYYLKSSTKLLFHSIINRVPNLNLKIWTYNKLLKQGNVKVFISNSHIFNHGCTAINTNKLLLKNKRFLLNEVSKIFYYNKNSKDFNLVFYTQYIEEIMPKAANKIEEITGLLAILAKKYKKRVMVKVHPSLSTDKYLKYENDYFEIMENTNLPGEILLLDKDIKSFSFYSSVGYVNDNKFPTHYWLYPMIKNEMSKEVVKSLPSLLNDDSNIELINSFNELEEKIFK